MKRILILTLIICSALEGNAQALGYDGLSLLFAQDNNYGTARYTAMGGAFGALGGDISSVNINPAGLVIFNNSMLSGTFTSRNTSITSNYYGEEHTTQDQYFRLPQVGAVLVFDTTRGSNWSKLAIGINYRTKTDFNTNFNAFGNSNIPTFRDFPLDDPNTAISYDFSDEQQFYNTYRGRINELNLAFSAQHKNRLLLGASLNFYDLNFSQRATLVEFNNDGAGNTLDAEIYQENFTVGSGVSVNLGFIYKATDKVRFGLSYQTPTWFTEIIEETNIVENDGFFGDTTIETNTSNSIFDNTADGFPSQNLIYRLRTPSKITVSGAFIFGKKGLLSVDYSNRNFSNMKLTENNFLDENQFFQNNLRNTHNLNIGTEWRFSRVSLRAGYNFMQDPLKDALTSDNIHGYSFGGAYDFGNFRLGLAYAATSNTSFYNAYATFPSIDSINLNTDNRLFTMSLNINL